MGQADFITRTSGLFQSKLNSPQDLAFDPAANRLFVGDTSNHRMMIFDVARITNGENAINVLGQGDFISGSPAVAQNRLNAPKVYNAPLNSLSAPFSQTYAYDTIGNITSFNGAAYTYGDPAHVHAVTAVGSNSYAYDANSNMTSRAESGATYTQQFDAENHLRLRLTAPRSVCRLPSS